MLKRAQLLATTLANNAYARAVALTLFYLIILAALLVLYGKGNFSTPPFIYQGF